MKVEKNIASEYQTLVSQISNLFVNGQQKVTYAVNMAMLETYW